MTRPLRNLRLLRPGAWPIVAALVAAALTCASSARADEPVRPIQHDAKAFPPDSTQPKLMLLGGALAVGWYAAAAVPVLTLPEAAGAKNLLYPVIGPWMALGDKGYTSCNHYQCATWWVVVRAVLTGFSGLGQVGGLALMLEGAFMPKGAPSKAAPRAHRAGLQSSTSPKHAGRFSRGPRIELEPVPWTSSDGAGLSLVGRF